jgi:hypothetical protein
VRRSGASRPALVACDGSCGEPDRKEASRALTAAYNTEQDEFKHFVGQWTAERVYNAAASVDKFNHSVLGISFPSDVKGDVDNLIRIDNDFVALARAFASRPTSMTQVDAIVRKSYEQDAAYQILKKDLDR